MYYWVIYDISQNRARKKVATACKRAGMYRVQKSVFIGKVRKKTMGVLRKHFNLLVNWRTDKVFFVPMSERDYQRIDRTGARQRQTLIPTPTHPSFY